MNRSLLALIALAFLVLPSPARAQAKILNIQPVTSAKNVTAWLVEDHSVPVISLSFAFRGGMALDPDSKPGVARLASIMMDEGAGDMDSQSFQKALADDAIELRFSAGRDAFRGTLRTITTNKDKAFSLLALALSSPRFDADALTRMKEANSAEIRDSLSDPDWLAARAFNGTVFAGHPYARPGLGTLPAMARITSDDLHRFARGQLARNLLVVSAAGDITADELAAALDLVFGELPDISLTPEVRDIAVQHPGKTVFYPFDVPQTFIMAGHDGIRQDDPSWHAAQLVLYTLGGGGFESRLMNVIREERGLTYGVSAGLSVMDHAALVQVDTSTANRNAGEVVRLIRQEWQKMASHGPTAEELADAKAYLTGALPLQLTSTPAIAEVLTGMQLDRRGVDYINERNSLLETVTPDDAKASARTLLRADRLTTVLVGRPEGIDSFDMTLSVPPEMEMTPAP